MLFKARKYYFSYLSAVTVFVTVFYLVFGPLFFSFESDYVPKAKAATVTWVAGATGTWQTAANWSSGSVPTTADDVVITSSTGNIAVTLSSGQTANFNSLTIGGDSTFFATTTFTGNIGTGGAITVSTKGVLEQDNFVNQTITGDLVVSSGGRLTHKANTTDTNTQDKAFLFTTPNFNLQSGAVMDLIAKGFAGTSCGSAAAGYGPGAGPAGSGPDAPGAGHGGLGGKGGDTSPLSTQFAYDDLTAPTQLGSSGGTVTSNCGGAGGGAAKITITGGGTATVSGMVTSTGGNGGSTAGRYSGGGSGGSVWFNFTSGGTFAGSGTIGAMGGSGSGNAFDDGGGGGGGGRIAITGHSSETFSGTFAYSGGTGGGDQGTGFNSALDGGSGTLYKKLSSATYGDLFVNNGSSTDFTPTLTSSTMTLANISLNRRANLVISSSTVLTLVASSLGTATVSSTLNVDGTFVTPSSFTVPAYNQVYASSTQISAITDLTIAANGYMEMDTMATTSVWVLNSLTVSGELTHKANTTAILHALMVSSTSITVNSGGSIAATGRGYMGGTQDSVLNGANGKGPGGGNYANSYGGGGGYGGVGGQGHDSSATGGATYGATSTPEYEAGSGGAAPGFTSLSHYGGPGGGIVKLIATTLTVSGTVSANGSVGTHSCGGTPHAGGGGAGGGVRIIAGTLSGSGSITANGGNGASQNGACSGGGGGGGRILITANTYSFSGTVTSTAGIPSTDPTTNATRGRPGSAPVAPSVPLVLYSASTTAQTGFTNPMLNTTTPFFSAIFSDVETGDTATKAHIQISTDANFNTISHWDSGSSGNTITSCAIGARCQDLKYKVFGTAPTQNLSLNDDADENTQTKYYWRIRFFDSFGAPGTYSTSTSYFTLLDAPNDPTGAAVSSVTATGATIGWTDNSAIEDNYVVEVALNGGSTFIPIVTTSPSVTSIATSTLSPDTQYQYRVKATNSAGMSAFSTTSAFYSLAYAAGTPTANAASASSIIVTLDVNNNPTTTAFAIYNETTGSYVAADGSPTASAIYQTTTTWGGLDVTATGLTPNTSYQFTAVARNRANVDAATSTASTAVYTLAAIPTNLVLQSSGKTITATWNTNSNTAGTVYNLDGFGNSYSSGNITNNTYQFTNLNPGTYSFRVRASNGANVSTAYTDAVSITIASGDSGGSPPSIPPTPPPPSEPPKPDDLPPDVPLDDFMPTGLLKIVPATSGEIDLLKAIGASGSYNITKNSDVKSVANSDVLNLQGPFTLDFSFAMQAHPLWTQAHGERQLFAKDGSYFFGFGGLPNVTDGGVVQNGLCFSVNNYTQQVCDNIFTRQAFAVGKRYDYKINWNGTNLDLYDGANKVATKVIGGINQSPDPIVIGGRAYKSNSGAEVLSYYPLTIYQMKLKSEPILIYTNQPNVKLKIDSTYAPEFALKQSDEGPSSAFTDVSFNPITSEMLWNLTGVDGKKCVNARFRSALKKFTYDTYACAILDRVKPPADFTFESGYNDNNEAIGPMRIFGITEPDSSVTISVTLYLKGGSTASVSSSSEFVQPGGSLWLAEAKPQLQLATAPLKSQYSLKANKDGTWESKSANLLNVGDKYVIAVQTRDLATNVSNTVTKEYIVGKDKPIVPPKDPEKPDEEPPKPDKPKDPPPTKPDKPSKPDNNNGDNNNGGDNSGNGGGSSNSNGGGGSSEQPGFFSNIVNTITETFTNTIAAVREFINNPKVQAINKKVAVPAAAVIALVNAALGFQLPYLINLLRYLFSQPAMILRRRKQKTWGVVYNSFTKEPVDLATIRLIDEKTGRVILSQVTDFHGRYFLSTNTGQYRLEVIKPGFAGFSEHLKEKDEDTKFVNLYHGAAFYAPHDQFEINYNVPLDPIVENKPVAKILRDNLWEKLQYALSFAGMAASLMSFVVTPGWYTGMFVALHVGLFILFYRFAHHKLPPVWGVVRAIGNKEPIGRVIVRVFDSAYNKLVNTGVTDSKGRYALLVGPSVYYVSYEKSGFERKKSPILDYSSKKTGGMGGIINRDEMLEKSSDQPPKVESVTTRDLSEAPKPETKVSEIDKANDIINNWKNTNS